MAENRQLERSLQVVLERDIDGGVITIRPLEGLFDDED